MYKETLTYTDYNGVERTEDFYFNLSKAEVMQMEFEEAGGLQNKLNEIVNAKDTAAIMEVFKNLIIKSYGEKSPDGKRFIKNKEIAEAFEQTEAFSELFMKFATDDKAASAFVNGIMPVIPQENSSVPAPAISTKKK